MKILITGNMGYVGPAVVKHLRATFPEAELVGFDAGFFAHCLTGASALPEASLSRQVFGDIRSLDPELLTGCDAVVHLAAISNDPLGQHFADVTRAINLDSTLRLFDLAGAAGVRSFVFASSCSVYGLADGEARREGDAVNPLTAYAQSKVGAEEGMEAADGEMTITCLRFATACGMSDRLRLDLVLNDFVASALATGAIDVLSDGTPWRPLIDTADMALAIEWALTRDPANGGRFLTVNAGIDSGNYQVGELAEAVAEAIPGTRVSISRDAPVDSRSYKVDFSLFSKIAKDHQPRVTLRQSIEQLIDGLRRMNFADAAFRTSPMMRLRSIQGHVEAGRLSPDLHWTARGMEPQQ